MSADSPPSSLPPRVAVIGGGIAGLSAAVRLTSNERIDVRLFEAGPRLGGVLRTERDGDWLIEQSADNFLTTSTAGVELCHTLGLADDLLPTNVERRGAMVLSRGQLHRAPEGFVLMAPRSLSAILWSPILSPVGRLRLMGEPLIRPKRTADDESVADFARRRLGREALDRLVQPLVGGIYTGDPERLSMRATMPQFVADEQQHGSLWRAARRASLETTSSGARYSAFVAPRHGMQQLVDRLAANIGPDRIVLNTPMKRLERLPDRWRVIGQDDRSWGDFAGVIVATPAHEAGRLLASLDSDLARSVAAIEYASSAVVCLGVHERQLVRPFPAFGAVIPACEGRRVLAISAASYKFPGRAPQEAVLLRVFVGGVLQPELVELDDVALVDLVRRELAELCALRGEPLLTRVVRWPRAMPQYTVGHLERVAQIEARLGRWPGLMLAGAAYRGVGIPQCVADGQRAADRLLTAVTATSTAAPS